MEGFSVRLLAHVLGSAAQHTGKPIMYFLRLSTTCKRFHHCSITQAFWQPIVEAFKAEHLKRFPFIVHWNPFYRLPSYIPRVPIMEWHTLLQLLCTHLPLHNYCFDNAIVMYNQTDLGVHTYSWRTLTNRAIAFTYEFEDITIKQSVSLSTNYAGRTWYCVQLRMEAIWADGPATIDDEVGWWRGTVESVLDKQGKPICRPMDGFGTFTPK